MKQVNKDEIGYTNSSGCTYNGNKLPTRKVTYNTFFVICDLFGYMC